MSAAFVVLAVGTGVVVIAVAAAVVLVVLIVAASMRGRGRRAAQRRADSRRDVDEREERVGQAEPDLDSGQGGGEDFGGRPG